MSTPSASEQPAVAWEAPQSAEPTVGWAPPPGPTEVPGAPGLVYATTGPRIVAYLVDGLVQGLVALPLLVALAVANGDRLLDDAPALNAVTTILSVGITFVYAVWFWTSGARATPGMRLFGMQIGDAATGRPLTVGQAVLRWIGRGEAIVLLSLVPALTEGSSGIWLLWSIVLVITIASHPAKRGLHDRFSGSAIVRARGAGGGATAALVVIALIVILPIVAAVAALVALGDQLEVILREVGNSI